MRKFLLALFLSFNLLGCSILPSPVNNEKVYEEAIETIPNFENTYYLSKLSGEDLAFVVKAYQGLMNFENKVEMNLKFKDIDRVEYLIELLQYDCPEIFQFSTNGASTVLYHWVKGTNKLVDVEFDYLMTKEEYEEALPLVENEVKSIVKEAKRYSNDKFYQELYVYDYITDICTYDESVKHYSDSYGVLIENRSACLGITRTMQWILNELGIPSFTVAGHGEDQTLGHAWNIIYLNEGYYCLDATADTCRDNESTYKSYRYFNVEDTYFLNEYTLQDSIQELGIPTCDQYDMNYYHHMDRYIYETADITYTFKQYLASFIGESGTYLLKIESKENYDYIVENLQELYEQTSEMLGYPAITISYAHLDEDNILYFIIERYY